MEEKKSTYKGTSDAQRKAVSKYLSETVEEFKVRVRKGDKEKYRKAAEATGESLNQFAVTAMDERIEREGLAPSDHID